MFIQTEPMPDPAALMFLPGRDVLGHGTREFASRTEAENSPLAARLFEIVGVSGVSLGSDFIIVTKENGNWQHLKPAILGAIMEHFMAGAPVLAESADPDADLPDRARPSATRDDLAMRIREELRHVIDPELGYNIVDLGLIYDVTVEDGGIAHITMTTTTPGCPATDYLKAGTGDSALRVPGVRTVDVKLTYDPRWTPEMMSERAKARFGIRDGGGW